MKDKKKIFTFVGNIYYIVEIFHVYYTCGKLGITFVGNFFITLVGSFITFVGIITVVGNFITLVGVITSRKFYYTCGSDRVCVVVLVLPESAPVCHSSERIMS